ncbi:histone methyltransferase set2 [Chytriomyces hyalinus]|nr:histone methyltransferase set2 [Chytriomyces hyalinus]
MEALKDELEKVYNHIERNEYKGGANGRIDDMEVMPCMCKLEPGDDPQMACGETSDCINRALFLECSADDCPCGYYCQNRRFWNMQYAPMQIIKTELKGFGLRALKNIKKGQFVIEYVGEVITQSMFIKRVREYSESGAKHFYFMSIKSDEVIDAYKKGNSARFMNHSCVPNCELQKWVVGSQIRMGFFAVMDVAEGEELTFDYKFERYGAEPQICYCGHSACKGIIGGQQKTVVGLEGRDDDEYDEEEEKLAVKPRRSKSLSDGEEDYEESNKVVDYQGLQTVEAVKVMVKLLLYSTSKPTKLIRLLHKLELTQNPAMQRKFLQYHGLLVLKSCLVHHCKSNVSICYQIMRILKIFPPVTRNSIIDCKIEDVMRKFVDPENGHPPSIVESAQELLDTWATYSTVYRIPKKALAMPDPQQQQLAENGSKRTASDNASVSNNQQNANQPTTSVFSAADLVQSNKRGKYEALRGNSAIFEEGSNSRNGSNSSLNGSSVGGGGGLPSRPITGGGGSSGNLFANLPSGQSPRSAAGMYAQSPRNNFNIDGSGSLGATGPSPLGMGSRIVEHVMDTLPNGWKTAKNDDGRIYYYHVETKETRWDFPRDVTANGPATPGGFESANGNSLAVGGLVQESKAKSSIIEGMSESEIDAIVQKAMAGSLATPDAVEAVKALRAFISEIVIKTLSKHKEELGSEKFKKVARKITHTILEKEAKLQKMDKSSGPSEETKAKIKKYTKKCYESFLAGEKAKKLK